MSRIPAETVDAISARIDPAEIIGRYVQLKVRGRKAVGLCPFHGERTPSFSVDLERGLWYCFGCGEGGSVYTFLSRIEGLNFPQVVKKLGDEVGILVESQDEDDPEVKRREVLSQLLERTAQYYAELLTRSPLGESARLYLKNRGFSTEIAEKFRLGWAPDGGEALLSKLKQAGYSSSDGVEAGVIRDRDGRHRDLLRSRLVFPITNGQGKVVAFGGRILEARPGSKAPKYLNTPETELYSKREHLYGLSFHRGEIARAKEAMVMEGYLDVISVSQAGFPLAVASLGTALTEEQCRLLARYARKVHLFYDADRAGRSATEKAIGLFENAGLFVHVAQMAQGEDPDSVIKEHGAEAFQRIKDSTVGVVDYLIQRKSEEFSLNTQEGKDAFSAAILPAIAKIKDDAMRATYIRTLETKLRSSGAILSGQVDRLRKGQSMFKKPIRPIGAGEASESTRPLRPAPRTSVNAEERLLSLMLKKPEWLAFAADRIRPEELSREDLRPFLEVLLEFRSNEAALTWSSICERDPSQESMWARLMAEEFLDVTSDEAEMTKLIRDIKRNGLKPRYEAVRREISAGLSNGTVGPDSQLYKEYLELQQRLKGTKNE